MNQVAIETPNILDMVLTTKEASELYPVADCTFRTWIKEGLFNSFDIKKSGNTWLIKKEAIEDLLKTKNIFGKNFKLDGQDVYLEHLVYKGTKLQIWYQDDTVKGILDNMPHKELIPQLFEVFKEDTKMNFKFVIIENNTKESDNWFFRKEKVWALTTKAVLETLYQSMQMKENFDTSEFEAYLKQVDISL